MEKQGTLILVVEDDDDDWVLVRDAFKEAADVCRFAPVLRRLTDGVELFDYLGRLEREPGDVIRPDLILLDLNMPRMGGKEVLRAIKSNPEFQAIPTVIYTTSDDCCSIDDSYRQGANSVLVKPGSFQEAVKAMGAICRYWFNTATLPENGNSN